MEEKSNFKEILKENILLIIIVIILMLISLVTYFVRHYVKNESVDTPTVKEKVDPNKIYELNEYRSIKVTRQSLINSYYSRYIKMTVDDPERSWDMLSKEGKAYFLDDIKRYVKFLKDKETIHTYYNTVVQYKTNGNVITIIDSENYKYNLYIYGIWDYEVEFVKLV